VYALIGLLVLDGESQVVVDSESGDVTGVPEQRYSENAHTRRMYAASEMEKRREKHGSDAHADVVVRGEPERSGRLTRCIDIGSYRDGAYRVRESLLEEWGGLSGTNDGFIQRSLLLPEFEEPSGFLGWLEGRGPEALEGPRGRRIAADFAAVSAGANPRRLPVAFESVGDGSRPVEPIRGNIRGLHNARPARLINISDQGR
jgi:hypothetical protein